MRQLNWNRIDMLEVVEFYADDNGGIASEQALSELFDSEIAPLVIEQYGGDRYIKSQAIHLECATGQIAKRAFGNSVYESRRRIDPPSVVDVVQSMLMYSDVLNYRGFAEWADNFGYDTDSRKAESIYRNCLEIALEMRSLFGEPEFTRLQEIASRF